MVRLSRPIYLENAVPRMALSAHLPDFLNVFMRALPSKPEAPVIRTEHPVGTLMFKAAIFYFNLCENKIKYFLKFLKFVLNGIKCDDNQLISQNLIIDHMI